MEWGGDQGLEGTEDSRIHSGTCTHKNKGTNPLSTEQQGNAEPYFHFWFCIPSSGFRTLKRSFTLSEL